MCEPVHAPELVVQGLVHGVVLGGRGGLEVERQQCRLRIAGRSDLVVGGLELARRLAEQADGGAAGGQCFGQGPTDAVARAADDDDPSRVPARRCLVVAQIGERGHSSGSGSAGASWPPCSGRTAVSISARGSIVRSLRTPNSVNLRAPGSTLRSSDPTALL